MLTVRSCDALAKKGEMGISTPTATSAPAGTKSLATLAAPPTSSDAGVEPGWIYDDVDVSGTKAGSPAASGTSPRTSNFPKVTSCWWPPSTGSAGPTSRRCG